MSKPRSLITSTAPLARSMSIPARGARKRLLLFVPYRGVLPTQRRTQQADAEVGAEDARAAEGGDAGRRTWSRARASAAAAEAAADAMAPRRAARVPKLPERKRSGSPRGAWVRVRTRTTGGRGDAAPCARVASPRARVGWGAYLLSGCVRVLAKANSEDSAGCGMVDKMWRRSERRAGLRPPLAAAWPCPSTSPPRPLPVLSPSTAPRLVILFFFKKK